MRHTVKVSHAVAVHVEADHAIVGEHAPPVQRFVEPQTPQSEIAAAGFRRGEIHRHAQAFESAREHMDSRERTAPLQNVQWRRGDK